MQEFQAWWEKQAAEEKEAGLLNAAKAKEPEVETEPEPELIDGALRLVVVEARKLKPMDRVGKNDPYVQVRVPLWNPERAVWSDGSTRRTTCAHLQFLKGRQNSVMHGFRTIEDGGSDPAWGFGEGEAFTFEACVKLPPKITVEVFDEGE